MRSEKKEMEYEDAPSGFVTLYNYKEPFMKFEEGFGFQGALLFDGVSDKVQCHFCGEWYHTLGNHLQKEHTMNVKEYKAKVGLSPRTALISETFREKLIASGLEARMKNFAKNTHTVSEETKEKIRNTMKENRREAQNLRGTCPEQLIFRLKKLYSDLGRTPRKSEIPFDETLKKVYGSLKVACEIADIPYREEGVTIRSEENREINRLKCIKKVKDFYETNGRFPTCTDLGAKSSVYRHMLMFGKKNIQREVGLLLNGKPRGVRFGKEELLDFIRRFKAMHGRNPSASDCRRKLLPGYSRYHYYWGSLKNACELVA